MIAVYALLGVYIWFMVLGPLMKLLTHDPNKDTGIAQSRSRWFLQLLIGVVPLVLVGYNWSKLKMLTTSPPKQDMNTFTAQIESIHDKLMHPQVVYLPYPSTATPVPPATPAPATPAPATPAPATPVPPATNKI